jgi:2-hydroxychromene-2-carboxylate isomerase
VSAPDGGGGAARRAPHGASGAGGAPRFFFGVMSPYSWLAAERIGALIPAAEWKPVFAGGVFKARDRVSWGLTAQRAAGLAECEARARRYGLGTIRWPEPWPTADHLAARAVLYAGARGRLRPMALELMRMAFREGCDLAEPDALVTAGRRVGLDGDDLGAAVVGPELRAELRRATYEALACGVVGVPTLIVGDELFWGDDRLEAAARAA